MKIPEADNFPKLRNSRAIFTFGRLLDQFEIETRWNTFLITLLKTRSPNRFSVFLSCTRREETERRVSDDSGHDVGARKLITANEVTPPEAYDTAFIYENYLTRGVFQSYFAWSWRKIIKRTSDYKFVLKVREICFNYS